MTLAALGLAALLVGLLVGTVGVGGVLMAPALILIGGVEPHRATAISLISFVLTGAVSAAMSWRDRDFPRRTLAVLTVGLVPGAFLGGALAGPIPSDVVLGALCAVSLFCALWTVVGGARSGPVRDGAGVGVPVGLVVGFGSAVTGTSGPVLLTPALLGLGHPARRAIVAGQVAQVLVTPAGAVGYLVRTRPDPGLTALLALCTATGTVAAILGTRRLHPPERLLRGLVVALLLVTAVLVAIRLVT